MRSKKTELMKWVDRKIASDAELRRMVEENLAEMRVEEEWLTRRAAGARKVEGGG